MISKFDFYNYVIYIIFVCKYYFDDLYGALMPHQSLMN